MSIIDGMRVSDRTIFFAVALLAKGDIVTVESFAAIGSWVCVSTLRKSGVTIESWILIVVKVPVVVFEDLDL